MDIWYGSRPNRSIPTMNNFRSSRDQLIELRLALRSATRVASVLGLSNPFVALLPPPSWTTARAVSMRLSALAVLCAFELRAKRAVSINSSRRIGGGGMGRSAEGEIKIKKKGFLQGKKSFTTVEIFLIHGGRVVASGRALSFS